MKPIFVDTSALIALGNKKDSFHQQAIEIRNQLKSQNRNFMTTNAILLEFGNAFIRIHLKPVAISVIKAIKMSQKWESILINELFFERAFTLYQKMNDKEWGLVDCSSIVIAKEREITEVFSTDRHFKQAGFTILLE
ncbi:MAG: type II toxin-antitoxin system VapC family toxin [Waterburya sp.]